MKRNIQFIVLVLAALCLNTEEAFAQNRSYSGDIGIEPVRLLSLIHISEPTRH